ncbi:MAG: DUF445 family protein [Clostridia bacterium]|nr:DUF445 family protein [Clostridia bacterium]
MLRTIAAPLMGGIIGYITNDLAIKMLFRPRKSVYIGKWHVPFTPGLIPSQKKRIAKSIGAMVSGKLLDGDTIREAALSEQTLEKLRGSVSGWLKENAGLTVTVRELLERMIPAEEVESYAGKISSGVSHAAIAELEKRNAGKLVTHMMLEMFRKKMQGMFFMAMIDEKMIASLEEPVAHAVNDAIRSYGPALLESEISKMEQELLDKRICDLTEQYTDRIDALVDMLTELYCKILTNHLDTLLRAANVSAIVEKKINSFSAAELEALIFGLMKRELSAIVYLGAALGFLMGFTNLLF